MLTSNDVEHIRSLLKPRQRRRAEANALLRTLMVSEQVAADPMGDVTQPTEAQVERFAGRLQKERDWPKLLPPLTKHFIGEVQKDGQFNVVWKTKGPIRAQPWSQYIEGNEKKKDEPDKK